MTSNSPNLWRRRRSSKVTDTQPRFQASVGVQLTTEVRESLKDMGDEERCAAHGALDDCVELDDRVCPGCGFHECGCAARKPEPEGASELGAWHSNLPRSWSRTGPNSCEMAPTSGTPGARPLAVKRFANDGFTGMRFPRDGAKNFASREAAMLYALGCTVTELGGERLCVTAGSRTYSVDTRSQAVKLVEMLTAERAG